MSITYQFITSAFLLISLTLTSCSKSSSSSTETTATMTTRTNQNIPSYVHNIDEYIPSNATSAIIFLHGGGGKKEGFAYNLGIKANDTNADYSLSASGENWLISNRVAAVFPQGQMPGGTFLSWTWNNYVMQSGVNDVAFLQALVATLKNDSAFRNVTRYYLVGHSNGGMMTNRMWCESSSTFDGYGALAGPPATDLAANGSHPCTPSVVKPYIGIIGDADSQLQTSGQMATNSWTCSNYNASSAAWASGTILNEKLYHAVRVTKKCSGSVNSAVINGVLSTYSDCSGSIQLIVVSGGDHCLKTINGGCSTILAGTSSLDYKTTLFNFLVSQ